VESELSKKDDDHEDGADVEAGEGAKETKKEKGLLQLFFSPVYITCFTMTFLAEWGDRSQIATIALAAAKDPFGVTVGGILGHSCCTGVAVVGGKLLASRISERTVILAGGVLFLLFAAHSIWAGPEAM
jgi:putative Ca2+/H+ antiporter (TMEM165/GDT1 family)